MLWTKNKPTTPGHYWFRDEQGEDVVFVFLRGKTLIATFCCVGEIEYRLDNFTKGEWSSTAIPKPSIPINPEVTESNREEQ